MSVFNTIETEQIGADLSQVVDRVTRQYEEFAPAFQKEFIQNSWDAREDRLHANDWKASISIFREGLKFHIVLEDWGTIGMDTKRWNAFLSLWKPEKSYEDAGGQGQGKFLLMRASKEHTLLVESVSDDLGYTFRYLKKNFKDKQGSDLSITKFIPSAQLLRHKGTRIWVFDATPETQKVVNSHEFKNQILESWWQLFDDRYNAKLTVNSMPITFPIISDSSEQKIIYQNHKFGNWGRIKHFVLEYHDEKIPESFRGVRIQRSNMSVTKIKFEVPEKDFDGKFSGYIEFDQELEKALKLIEKTDHGGFLYESPWREIKKIIQHETQKFVKEILPTKTLKRQFSFDTSKLIRKANQIINDHCPDILGTEGTVMPPLPPKELGPIRIKYLNIGKTELKYNDVVIPSCKIINQTEKYRKLNLAVDLKYSGSKVAEWEYRVDLKAGKDKLINMAAIRLLQGNYRKGKYTFRITLRDDKHDIDSKSSSFYLEEVREASKKGFVKDISFYESTEPLRNQPISNGVIAVNFGHPEMQNIYTVFEKKPNIQNKQIGYYIVKICIDEAVSEYSKAKFRDLRGIDMDDVMHELVLMRDSMYSDVYR